MRPHGRSRTIRMAPRAHAICDRCGFMYDHAQLGWQFDWRGPHKMNLRILVCPSCLDKAQEQLRTIVLPPDPYPIENPRPETYTSDDNPISPLGWDATQMYTPPPSTLNPANIGTMTAGGGVDAAFYGARNKVFGQSALALVSVSSFTNYVGKNWTAIPGSPTVPSSLAPIVQSYAISGVSAYAPLNAPFLSTGATGYHFDGSNDGLIWTTLFTGTTIGGVNETVTIPSSGLAQTPFGYHRFVLQGDGINPVAIALLELNAAGQSFAATGSELGA